MARCSLPGWSLAFVVLACSDVTNFTFSLLVLAAAHQALSKSWADTLAVFDSLLATLKECHVPKVLVQVGALRGQPACDSGSA